MIRSFSLGKYILLLRFRTGCLLASFVSLFFIRLFLCLNVLNMKKVLINSNYYSSCTIFLMF